MNKRLMAGYIAVTVSFLAACDSEIPTPTPSPAVQTQTSTTVPSITISPTRTYTPTITTTPTVTPTPTITLMPTLLPGKAPLYPPTYSDLFINGSREKPMVALTFDVGETPKQSAGFDEGIFQVLVDNQAKATFFLGGIWMRNHPEETRRLAANPLFELGNHSWSHTDFPTLSEVDMFAEILWANDILYQLTGESSRLFRFPSGAYNDLALSVVGYAGMYAIQWDVVTADPIPDNEAENIIRLVMERVKNGSIIIMHANGRGWNTAEALPEMIRWLRSEGYILITPIIHFR